MIFRPGDIFCHYSDAIMRAMASQITGVSIVCSNLSSGAGQRKHQSSASLAFVRGICRWPVKGPVTRKMFPFDDVIMHISFRNNRYRQTILANTRRFNCNFLDSLGLVSPQVPAQLVLVPEFCVRKGITWHPMFHERVQKFIWHSIKL